MRIDLEYFDEQYRGALNVDVMIDSGKEGGVKEPKFLNETLRLQEALEQMNDVGEANSIVDYIRKMNQSFLPNLLMILQVHPENEICEHHLPLCRIKHLYCLT